MAYNRKRISHKNEFYYILCIAAIIVILFLSFFGPGGYRELTKLRLERQELSERVENLKHSNDERKKNIKALRSDPEALERYARDIGYARKEDIILQLPSRSEKKTK
jgi:cell division protein FtsB